MKKEDLPVVGIAQINGAERNDYLSANFIISDPSPRNLEWFERPCRLDGTALCVCMHGNCRVTVNQSVYEIGPHDLFVVLPVSTVQILAKSPDFRGYVILFTIDFLTGIEAQAVVPFFAVAQDRPLLSLEEEYTDMLLEYCAVLSKKSKRYEHPYNKEIVRNLLLGLFYETSALYQRELPSVHRPVTQHEQLVKNLLRQIFLHYKEERSVGFYAERLCLTPKYLSSLVKRVSGKTVSQWIETAVILEAKTLLKSTQMTVQQISDRLNFPNPSFFGRYFKQHTGMTPKEYRLS